MDKQFDAFFLTSGTQRIGIQPDGCYVSSWMIGDLPILYIGSQLKRSGIPLLFPYFGKAEGKRMHGFGRNVEWRVKEKTESSVVLTVSEEDLSDDMHEEYPYLFEAKVTIDGSVERVLTYTIAVTNRDEVAIPVAPGLHPYWAIGHDEKSQIQIDGIEGFDAKKMDWSAEPPDTVYGFDQKATLTLPEKTVVIEEISEGKPQIQKLVVWSQTPVRDADFDFVCVEPTTRANFGIDEDPIMIEPKATWQMGLRFSVE